MASHIAQPEGPTTRIYNCVLGGFGEKKKKRKRRLATDVGSGANLSKKKKGMCPPHSSHSPMITVAIVSIRGIRDRRIRTLP